MEDREEVGDVFVGDCGRGGGEDVYLYFGGKFDMGIDFWLNGVTRMD